MKTSKKRPVSITILSWLYIAVGVLGPASHYSEFAKQTPKGHEAVWIIALGAAAAVAGVSMLYARNWARWLALAWMAAHVAISAVHPHNFDLIVHSFLFALFAYLLFRRDAQIYFRET
ncbi:MAG: hypothetical protein WBP85_00270 [Terracidiphilus sp.]